MGFRNKIGTIDIRNVGGINWAAYWARQPEVLFFGLYSDISGGQMPNRVHGATDYLTVAGAVGSETYQCPNTAPYIAADTDYIWFKIDESQRTTTTAELVGYDFTRTIIKYDNTAPYALRWIMILSEDYDTDAMRDSFDLSIWWSNVLSAHGSVKGNRGVGRSFWIIDAIIRARIDSSSPTKVNLIFAFDLDDTSIPAVTDFALAGKIITDVAILGNVVTLTVSVAYVWGAAVTVSYAVPVSNLLKSLIGNLIAAFTGYTVENYINFIGHYKFDEGTGIIAYDSGGYIVPFDGAISGASYVAGKIGAYALSFAVNDFVNLDAHGVLNPTQGTLAMWVKPVDATPGVPEWLMGYGDTDGTSTLSLHYLTTGVLRALAVSATTRWDLRTDANPFADGVWCHIGVTHNGTAPILYINGVAVAQTFASEATKTVWKATLANLDNARIGCNNNNSGGNTSFLNGSIDDVRIYNRALTVSEMAALAAM